jgi:hypothetical protein
MFSMSSAPNNGRTVLCNPFLSNENLKTSTIIGVFRVFCAECLKRSEFRCKFSSGQLRVAASHSREPVGKGHEDVIERSCEDSAVKC